MSGRPHVLLRLAPAIAVVALAVAGPLLRPHPIDTPVTMPYGEAADGAPLGGDLLGRDVLSRLLDGGVELLTASTVIAVIVTFVSALLGALAALRPMVGRVIERAADIFILLPVVLGILLVAHTVPGNGTVALIVAAVVMSIPYATRVAVAAATPIAATGYVTAAVGRGESLWHLVIREVLPNMRATVLTLFGLRFVAALYIVATAGFLQIGPQPPEANWALMVRENAPGILLNPWGVLAPSLAIGLLAVGVNLAADALAARTGHRAEYLA